MDKSSKSPRKSGPGVKAGTPQKGPAAKVKPPANPVAGAARPKLRHYGIFLSFLLIVAAPSAISIFYLETIAADQYASTVGFSVRRAESTTPVDILGGITGLSSGSSADTDVLYQFVQSQNMVQHIDKEVNLRKIFSKASSDPVFSFDPSGSIEDLVSYWARMVKIHYDAGTGLMEIRVNAFDPLDAQIIAKAIFQESSVMINRLSAIARDDATRYAKADLTDAVKRLKTIRKAVTEFRSRTQIVDPQADIQGQMSLLNVLQQQKVQALIELDLLRATLQSTDPRIEQASLKISVIETRISEERKKFGVGGQGAGDADYASLISEYEGLIVERDFAEKTYLANLTAFETAKTNAQRQSRYLAAYVAPTLAETAEYPQRLTISALIMLFLFLAWAILSLVYYSIRDRR